MPFLRSGEAEGGLCLPDRPRDRDRDEAVPGCAERHRETSECEHQHTVRCQLWHTLGHLPIQGGFPFCNIGTLDISLNGALLRELIQK